MKNLASVAFAAALVAPAAWADTNFSNAPSGAHYANGSSEPVCTKDPSTQDVRCTATVIGGVGHTNADVVLSATYSGTVQCRNNGGQIVEVKTQTTQATSAPNLTPDRNGQLTVGPLNVTAPTDEELEAKAKCPNKNWTAELQGHPALVSYVYTLTFKGFDEPAISIVGR